MGRYLNSKKPGLLFREDVSSTYFVDKSGILNHLITLVESGENVKNKGNKYICITRPRRFGKTMAANMISAYFGKGMNSHEIFSGLNITSNAQYKTHLNHHNVIHIMFNEFPDGCASYEAYISRIKTLFMRDLLQAFPDVGISQEDALWDVLNQIIESGDGERFIFVLDEWDYIFHQDFVTEADKKAYIGFLSALLKDQPYVEFVYMTGILPIAKYSSGSELNVFFEYTMSTREKYSEYFGFTEEEVDELYRRYLNTECIPKVSREGLRFWYDGYQTVSGKKLYNPRSVVGALSDNQLGNYWTSSGPYDEIFYYVEQNVDQVREDLVCRHAEKGALSGLCTQACERVRTDALRNQKRRYKNDG